MELTITTDRQTFKRYFREAEKDVQAAQCRSSDKWRVCSTLFALLFILLGYTFIAPLHMMSPRYMNGFYLSVIFGMTVVMCTPVCLVIYRLQRKRFNLPGRLPKQVDTTIAIEGEVMKFQGQEIALAYVDNVYVAKSYLLLEVATEQVMYCLLPFSSSEQEALLKALKVKLPENIFISR